MDKPSIRHGSLWASYVYWRIHRKFPKTSNGGIFNCRKIANSSSWSQHAYANAVDVMVKERSYGDAIYKWLHGKKGKLRFNINHCLWEVPDHYDHLHLDFSWPGQSSTPDCAK